MLPADLIEDGTVRPDEPVVLGNTDRPVKWICLRLLGATHRARQGRLPVSRRRVESPAVALECYERGSTPLGYGWGRRPGAAAGGLPTLAPRSRTRRLTTRTLAARVPKILSVAHRPGRIGV